MKKRYKTFSGQRSFFGDQKKLEKLQDIGNRLLKLKKCINWEVFRPLLENYLYKVDVNGGRPPYDYIIMMKILILQRYYNLSDSEIEYQLNDRLSFQDFLDIGIDDDIPDESTISHFKEQLQKYSLTKKIFKAYLREAYKKGIVGKRGRIVDASFVEVPRQRNTREENDNIKAGVVPPNWTNQNSIAQKDVDARWTKKNEEVFYGYKNHVKSDEKSKLILNYEVTDASIHDSQVVEQLLEKEDKILYADSAYKSEEFDGKLEKRNITNKIIERAYRNTPLTETQIKNNKIKSSRRVRIEHIFGFIENSMGGSFIRSIGKEMADVNIGIMNLTYNLFRVLQLT